MRPCACRALLRERHGAPAAAPRARKSRRLRSPGPLAHSPAPVACPRAPERSAVPHPMALGSLIALGGAYLLPGLRADVPWLVPTHAALTGLHLAQEILDIHA